MRGFADLPVSVALPGVLGQEVTAYVEGEAGWQVVADAGPPRPLLAVVGAAVPGRACVVVVDGTPTTERVRAELRAGAVDVLGWPADRHRLLDAPLRVRAGADDAIGPTVLRIGGLCGGAGASTFALAVAGLLAWSGRPTLVVGHDDLLWLAGVGPWRGAGAAELAGLPAMDAASEVMGLARPVAGAPNLMALGGGGPGLGSTGGWPVATVVADVRTTGRADVLVARPDAGLRAAVDGDSADRRPVVLVGRGPLGRGDVRRLLGRRLAGWLPESARVSRAGAAGRLPSALPGAWLSDVRTVVGRLGR